MSARSLALLALLLLAAGCVSSSSPAPAAPAARAPDAAFARVHASLDLDGAPAAKHFEAGQPVVFVVFASWCVHCRHELAVLTELQKGRPGVHIIGLNAYEDFDDASNETLLRAYLAASAPWLPVVHADDALLRDLGGVPKIPSLFVFDAAGHLAKAWKRNERVPPTRAELEDTLSKL
jgi:thiol-disulfide isomerase/thioredoxin